ncbi:MAG: D-aminoacyl-tRNA deacylase [Candidatus Hydrogenedentota bacterium]
MRAVVQRVSESSVTVDGIITGKIDIGLLVLIGVAESDETSDAIYIAEKIAGLRCFMDEESKFNRSVKDVNGAILAISQFTLFGDCRRGRRPSFTEAARPEKAVPLYEAVIARLRESGLRVETGVFGAHMDVHLVNDGPVTLLLDSNRAF